MRFQQHRDASCHQVFFSLQGKAPKEIHDILTETLACFLPGRAKDLSATLYFQFNILHAIRVTPFNIHMFATSTRSKLSTDTDTRTPSTQITVLAAQLCAANMNNWQAYRSV